MKVSKDRFFSTALKAGISQNQAEAFWKDIEYKIHLAIRKNFRMCTYTIWSKIMHFDETGIEI